MSKLKVVAPLLGATVLGSLLFVPSAASQTVGTNAVNTTRVPVRGVHRNGNRAFDGTMRVRRFTRRDGSLTAVGNLSGTVFGRGGGEKGTVSGRQVRMPVRIRQASSCDILRLVLGPLDLNLLGLRVQLNRVRLRITAEPGPGNLLGNLLCAVAGLLDRTGVLGVLRNILNSVLAVLRNFA